MIFGQISTPGTWDGFTEEEQTNTLGWFSGLFLVFLICLFGSGSVAIGLGFVSFFLFIFLQFKWIDFGNPWLNYTILSLCVLVTVLVFWLEENRK